MTATPLSRRSLIQSSAAVVAGHQLLRLAGPAHAFPALQEGEVIPWIDQPEPNPVPDVIVRQLDWEALADWQTPNDDFFVIKHFNLPEIDLATWQLHVEGLVDTPLALTLEDLQARPAQDLPFTIECSGNTGLPFFDGGIGNAVWTGTPLAPLLEEANVQDAGTEVVFWGADSGDQVWNDKTITEHFARSLSLEEAMHPEVLLAWAMNAEPLPALHGAPVRLIVPGWYGIANVKWLTRIELRSQRYAGNFMAREYVTMREVTTPEGEKVWTFSTVSQNRLKSAPAKVTRQGEAYQVMGAAWGDPIGSVEVRIDDGPWEPATITEPGDALTWAFWTYDWADPTPGEHTVSSRAIAEDGAVQPAPDDPFLAGKTTYWESNGQITRHVQIS